MDLKVTDATKSPAQQAAGAPAFAALKGCSRFDKNVAATLYVCNFCSIIDHVQ